MEKYSVAKQKFLDAYLTFRNSDDLVNLIHNEIIPHFDFFSCDLKELIEKLETLSSDNKLQALEYVELVFTPQLYTSIIESMKSTEFDQEFNFSHYMIIMAENYKREKYLEIKNNLDKMDNSELKKSLLHDVLLKGTQERINLCVERIKYIYNDLKNYDNLTNSKLACDIFLKENNINI